MRKSIIILICFLLIVSILSFSVSASNISYQTTVKTTPSDLTITNYYGNGHQSNTYPYYQINESQVAYTCQLKYFTSQLDFILTFTNDYYDNGLSFDESTFVIDYIFKIPVGDISNFSNATGSFVIVDSSGYILSSGEISSVISLGTTLNPGYETYRIPVPVSTSTYISHSPITMTLTLDMSKSLWNTNHDSELILQVPLEYVLSYSVEESNSIALATQSLIQNRIVPSVENIQSIASSIQASVDAGNITLGQIKDNVSNLPQNIINAEKEQTDKDIVKWNEEIGSAKDSLLAEILKLPVVDLFDTFKNLGNSFNSHERVSTIVFPSANMPTFGEQSNSIQLWQEYTVNFDDYTSQVPSALIIIARCLFSILVLWGIIKLVMFYVSSVFSKEGGND